MWLLLGYLFLAFSRILDVIGPGVRLPIILAITMGVVTLISGQLFEFLHTAAGRWMLAFTVWVAVTIPFSTWRGGSAGFLIDTLRSFGVAIVIIAVAPGIAQLSRLLRVIAYSILVGALLSFFFGQLAYGRLVLAVGTFGDPNQYAMTLLFSLPFWIWIARTVRWPAKLLPYACMLVIFIAFLRTGSRGAGIGFAVLCLTLLWQAPASRKLPLLLFFGIVLSIGLALLPTYIRERYVTFFKADSAVALTEDERVMREGADIGSSEARLTLLVTSIKMTALHPFFGVGPGQFSYQAWQHWKSQGQAALFNETHNTYTQVSSELGIPGLILFLGLLVSTINSLRSIKKLTKSPDYKIPPAIVDCCDTLLLSLVVLFVCAFFLSLLWGPLFFVFPAIIGVFDQSVRRSLEGWRAAAPLVPALGVMRSEGHVTVPDLVRPSSALARRRLGRSLYPTR